MDAIIATLFQEGEYEKVLTVYNNSEEVVGLVAQYFVAISFLFQNKFDQGKSLLITLKKDQELLPDYGCYLALAHLKCGDYKKAKRTIDQVKKTSLLYFETNVEISMKMSHLRRAQRLINEARSSGAHSLTLEINSAILLIFKRKLALAEKKLLTLVESHSDNQLIYDCLVKIYMKKAS